MFNLTFYDNKNSSNSTSNEIKNPFVVLAIITVISLIIFFLGFQNYKNNNLLNKQTKGVITSASCSKVYRNKGSSTTSCTVNYKYSVDNKELSGTYTGGWNTETRVGKEIWVYYNDKDPLFSSMKKNKYTPIIMMFSAISLFLLGVNYFVSSKN